MSRSKQSSDQPNSGQIIFYTAPNGATHVEVRYEDETFWLTQKQISELFGVDRSVVTRHLKNIFADEELNRDSVCAEFAHTAPDGKTYQVQYYALDAIIAVGYRVNSKQATHFRIWATATLKEFIIKGFVLDDERLKLNKRFGKDYFDELLERIREIRASERRFYLKITDIYEQASIDYDPKAEITQTFFKTVQNKLHWAVSGMTAAEITAARADAEKPTMGLTVWKNSPTGKILKSDVGTAKNYLIESEIKVLDRIVSMYLDFAELQASRQVAMRMADWVERLDAFLAFNGFEVLTNAGKVSAEVAKRLAEEQYDAFRVRQDRTFEGDFEREVKRIEAKSDED